MVVFFLNSVQRYRVPFFNELARRSGKRLRIVVSSVGAEADLHPTIEVKHLSASHVGPFVVRRGYDSFLRGATAIVWLFSFRELNLLACLLRGRRPAPIIVWGHGYGRFSSGVLYLLGGIADRVVVYDWNSAVRLAKRGVDSRKVFVAHNSVSVVAEHRKEHENRRSFLFVGRLQKRKRIDVLIAAASKLKHTVAEDFRVEIVGAGPEREALEDSVRRLGLADRVKFHGEIYDPSALSEVFARALAYVSPGHVGLGVLHAFAHGVPCVTDPTRYHAPEVHNLIADVNAKWCFDGAEGLARTLRWFLKHPDQVQKLGENALQTYRWADMHRMVRGMLDCIDSLE